MKLDRKNIDLQTFLDNLDFSNINNIASELLEFEDDDEANEGSGVGSKRNGSHINGEAILETNKVQKTKDGSIS